MGTKDFQHAARLRDSVRNKIETKQEQGQYDV